MCVSVGGAISIGLCRHLSATTTQLKTSLSVSFISIMSVRHQSPHIWEGKEKKFISRLILTSRNSRQTECWHDRRLSWRLKDLNMSRSINKPLRQRLVCHCHTHFVTIDWWSRQERKLPPPRHKRILVFPVLSNLLITTRRRPLATTNTTNLSGGFQPHHHHQGRTKRGGTGGRQET